MQDSPHQEAFIRTLWMKKSLYNHHFNPFIPGQKSKIRTAPGAETDYLFFITLISVLIMTRNQFSHCNQEMDDGRITLLIQLDLLVGFDIISYDILMKPLVGSIALQSFHFYLRQRTPKMMLRTDGLSCGSQLFVQCFTF